MTWFNDAKFGMFIHWGVYSALGGHWKNMETPWVSEWIMRKFQIPRANYSSIAKEFNPVNFDAERWVKTALNAGMKYMVITSKHHDGFAMYHSTWDRYNIVDATPFGRDPLAELAAAAKKRGLRLGFYYSHEQDWNEPGATGNTWDFTPEQKTADAFEAYLNGKVRHQITELLTHYGEVSQIWFDTPDRITAEQSRRIRDLVRHLAPHCLINSRIGNDCFDYVSLGDNQLPPAACTMPTEGLGTMNESWGYKPFDHGYRSTGELLKTLAFMASRGANYLLNVGPDGNGAFPPEALARLQGIGSFLKCNGEALYGTSALPMWHPENRWGYTTCKDNKIYFWCFSNPGELRFYGIRNNIRSVENIGGAKIPFTQDRHAEIDYHRLLIKIPAARKTPFVIRVTCEGTVDCNNSAWHAC